MKTFKVTTKTNINYVLVINELYFAVRKNTKGYWQFVSYDSNKLSTDDYEVRILDGIETKKEAICNGVQRIKEVPKGFYHV